MPRDGRPIELTQAILDRVKQVLPVVLYLETVADYIGISRISFRGWLKRGAREIKRLEKSKRNKPLAKEAIFVDFFNVVKSSIAEGEVFGAGVIKRAATPVKNEDGEIIQKGQWQAAAWLLERRFPERWAEKQKLEHGNPGDNDSEVVVKVLGPGMSMSDL